MSHDDKCVVETLSEVGDEGADFIAIARVEAPGRFVGEDHTRAVDQRSRYGYSLTFAAGEL